MNANEWRLRRLPFSLRLALAALLLSLALGEAASLYHLYRHHEKKDEAPGLSFTDLEGSYRGVDQPSRLKLVLDAPHGRDHLPDERERAALSRWLAGRRINDEYDSVDLGELAPAEILARRCVSCHARSPKDAAGARGIGATLPLEFWDDVAKAAFERRLDPVPVDVLAMSTHAHALTLPLVLLAVGALALLTRWPRRPLRWLVAAGCVGLFVDLASWWLARADVAWLAPLSGRFYVALIVAGGALFAAALALELALILADLVLPSGAFASPPPIPPANGAGPGNNVAPGRAPPQTRKP
jgi:hypothetical protein